MFTVTVLTPKGRRQQVKVTPNTTLLQILEEVCTKHGFKAEEYDLRHHNKVLDISSIFRFTSLPNNAQLEMTEAIKQRKESPVTLGLHFESGERVTGVFSPSDTIWDIIVKLKPDEEKSQNVVAIYMRQEIFGKENLNITTLRSLGLTGGRAMLRVLHKSPEELRTQANVSKNLAPRPPMTDSDPIRESLKSSQLTKTEVMTGQAKSPDPLRKNKSLDEPGSPSGEGLQNEIPVPKYQKNDAFTFGGNVFEKILKDEKTRRELMELKKNKTTSGSSKNLESVSRDYDCNRSPDRKSKISADTQISKSKKVSNEKGKSEDCKVILLGERNAVAFNLNNVKPIEFEEEPEDFYDLTLNDAKLLLKQAKQLCADLEDAPLMTSAQRELEKDKKVLSALHQYKKAVIRIKFPDRTVLQGTFSPLETIGAVEEFVKSYLENPNISFYLYTTPPKVILNRKDRLIECNCVPCAVVYFGMPAEASPPSQYLKSEVLQKLSTLSAAAITAYQSRGIERQLPEDRFLDEAEKRKWSRSDNNSEAGPSSGSHCSHKSTDPENSPQFKVPKWFKTNK